MQTSSNKDKIFLGRKKGMEILKEIKNAKKSVKIVSPYLSPSYIKELVRLREKDIPITLITCDELEQNSYSDFRPSDIIKQKKIANPEAIRKKKTLKTISVTIFLIAFIIFLLSFLIIFLVFLLILLIIVGLVIIFINYSTKAFDYKYYSTFRLKVFDSKSGEKPWSTNLIHSKIFLIDDKILFLGSANFTYSAFTTHYETIIKVEDPKAISDITEEIERLFNSTELNAIDIKEWGRIIYEQK
jgi:phosphatidylserine/phosphatidylglycerophosphate/cardiolipin synthase-like enzyme